MFDFQDVITASVFEALQIKFAAELGGASVDPTRFSSVNEMRAVNEGRRELLKFTPEAHKKFEDILMKEYNAGSRSGPLINALGWLLLAGIYLLAEKPSQSEPQQTEASQIRAAR